MAMEMLAACERHGQIGGLQNDENDQCSHGDHDKDVLQDRGLLSQEYPRDDFSEDRDYCEDDRALYRCGEEHCRDLQDHKPNIKSSRQVEL